MKNIKIGCVSACLVAIICYFVVVAGGAVGHTTNLPFSNAPSLSVSERAEVDQLILNRYSLYYDLKENGRAIRIDNTSNMSCRKDGKFFVTRSFDILAQNRTAKSDYSRDNVTYDHTFVYSNGPDGIVMEKICPTW